MLDSFGIPEGVTAISADSGFHIGFPSPKGADQYPSSHMGALAWARLGPHESMALCVSFRNEAFGGKATPV